MESKNFIKRIISGGILLFLLFLCHKSKCFFSFFFLTIDLMSIYEFRKLILNINTLSIKQKNFYTFLLIAYTGLFLFAVIYLRNKNLKYVMFLFGASWSYDCFALIFGKMFGRTKITPKISPNKTVEGAIFGFIFSMLFSFILFKDANLFNCPICVAALMAIFAHFGDIFISYIKRRSNTKHSGTIIPGHGGVLDRFDSIFLNAILLFIIVFLKNYSI